MHFEIAGPDGPVLQQFYRDLFGWKIDVQSEEMGNYGLASANEGSIGGGVFPTTEDMPARSYVTFYVQVDDLQAALDKVAGMGGSVIMPPMEIAPGMGSIAMFGDPADNTIGVVNQRKWDSIGPEKVMVMKSGERALPTSPCGRMTWSPHSAPGRPLLCSLVTGTRSAPFMRYSTLVQELALPPQALGFPNPLMCPIFADGLHIRLQTLRNETPVEESGSKWLTSIAR